jgi:hypothetical protein
MIGPPEPAGLENVLICMQLLCVALADYDKFTDSAPILRKYAKTLRKMKTILSFCGV